MDQLQYTEIGLATSIAPQAVRLPEADTAMHWEALYAVVHEARNALRAVAADIEV